MCLFTNRKTPYIAKKDIIVYKVVCTNSNGIYKSFYTRFPYKLGKVLFLKVLNIIEE